MKIQKFNERSIPLPIKNVGDKKLIIMRGDDWEGVYHNGKLLYQGHSINWVSVIGKLGYTTASNYIGEEYWEQLGWALPENIEDVQKIIEIKKYNI